MGESCEARTVAGYVGGGVCELGDTSYDRVAGVGGFRGAAKWLDDRLRDESAGSALSPYPS
jgi:hypothetical protein